MHRVALLIATTLALSLAAACTPSDDGGPDDGSLYNVGDSRTFWAYDLSVMPPEEKEVPASARAITANTYVFVEDALWNDGTVTQAMLDSLVERLETSTPVGSINEEQGIIANNVDLFGPVPDALDGDPRFYILLMNIEGFQNFEFDGFFRSFDQLPDADAVAQAGYHSNEVEMLFLNAEIRPADSEVTESVIAHEMYHMIEWGLDDSESAWLSESMGEVAMTINGFYTDSSWVSDFAAHPNEPLEGGQFSVHYGACLLWGNYLLERFGSSFISDLVSLTSDGEASIDEALSDAGESVTFEDVFLDWVATNALDEPSAGYGYEFADIPDMTVAGTLAPGSSQPINLTSETLATQYVSLEDWGSTVDVEVSPSNPTAGRMVLIRYDSTDRSNAEVTFPAFGAAPMTVDLSGTYDQALLGLVGYSSAVTYDVSIVP